MSHVPQTCNFHARVAFARRFAPVLARFAVLTLARQKLCLIFAQSGFGHSPSPGDRVIRPARLLAQFAIKSPYRRTVRRESGRGLPHSKTHARVPVPRTKTGGSAVSAPRRI